MGFSFDDNNGNGNGNGKMPPPKVNGSHKREEQLTKQNWQDVLEQYAHTGKPSEIAAKLGLARLAVEDLIERGLPRLGLPGIRNYAVDTSELHLDMKRQRDERQAQLARTDVTEAITERAVSETAVAALTLESAANSGILLGAYADAMVKKLQSGEMDMAFPEAITPGFIETLAKAMKANAEATEKAVKLVRLTAGAPTELIEHKIAGLIAMCTTEELREAAMNNRLPRRLTSRLGGSADPLQTRDGFTDVGEAAILNVDYTPGQEPSWVSEIVPPEEDDSEDEDEATDA